MTSEELDQLCLLTAFHSEDFVRVEEILEHITLEQNSPEGLSKNFLIEWIRFALQMKWIEKEVPKQAGEQYVRFRITPAGVERRAKLQRKP